MGPPRNVRVQATVEGYLVTWEPPSEGRGQVRLYVVRWFRGPAQHLYGRSETTDTYYLGRSSNLSLKLRIISQKCFSKFSLSFSLSFFF